MNVTDILTMLNKARSSYSREVVYFFWDLIREQIKLGAHSNGGKHRARHTGVTVAYYKESGNVLEAQRGRKVGWG